MSTQLHEQIQSSELTNEDKEDFILFAKNISDEEIIQLTQLFNKDTSEIVPFWMTLKKKLIFMELLDKNTDFSNEAKDDIRQQISKMNSEEFDTFLSAIQEISDGADIAQKMNSISEQSKKNADELSSLTKKLISE